MLADVISILLLAPEIHGGRDFIEDVLTSDHHAEVYQATGMVAVHLGVSLADALAHLQYTADVGPCLQALRSRAAVECPDLADEMRWGPYPAARPSPRPWAS